MNWTQELIIEKLSELLGVRPEKKQGAFTTDYIFPNPHGGAPAPFSFEKDHDIQMTLRKTPRYYPTECTAIDQLMQDVGDYTKGKRAILSYCDRDGKQSGSDRFISTFLLKDMDRDKLERFLLRIGLIHTEELSYLLLTGGYINAGFWDPALDFRFRQKGADIIREAGPAK